MLSTFSARNENHGGWVVGSVFVLITGILLGLPGCSRDPHVLAKKHLDAAHKYMDAKKYKDAEIELRQSLQLDSKVAESHYLMGKVFLEEGNPTAAYNEFFQAARLKSDYLDPEIEIADLLARSGDLKGAQTKAEEILTKSPDSVRAKIILAESLMGQQQFDRATTIVNDILKSNPNDWRALYDLGALQMRDKQWDKAEATLRRSWQLNPDSVSAIRSIAEERFSRGDVAGAESILKEAVQQQPQKTAPLGLLAQFYYTQKRYGDAENTFRKITQVGKDDPNARGALAGYYLSTGRTDDAERELKTIVSDNPKDKLNSIRLASLYVGRNQPADALAIVNRLLKENPKDSEILLVRGQISLQNKDAKSALHDFQDAQIANPDLPSAYFYMAVAQTQLGDTQQAKSSLNNALRRDPNFTAARAMLGELEVNSGETQQAVEDLTKVLQTSPTVQPLLLRSRAYAEGGNYQAAEQDLNTLLKAVPDGPGRAVVLETAGWVKLQQRDFKASLDYAKQSLKLKPDSTSAAYMVGYSYLGMNQRDKAVQEVRAIVDKQPKSVAAYDALGTLSIQAGNQASGEQAFRAALQMNPNDRTAQFGLVEALIAKKDYAGATAILDKVSPSDPQYAVAILRVAEIQETQGDWKHAMDNYDKAIKADPKNAYAKNNLAYLYLEHGGNVDLALKLAEDAKAVAPDDPHFTDTVAWVYLKKGAYDTAANLLRDCVAKDPRNPSYNYHLGVAYYQQGKYNDARQSLEAALKLPGFTDAADATKLLKEMPQKK